MNKERIMVVEDEKLIARDIKDCLEKLGYSVTSTVATGEAAVRGAEEDLPDLTLMDIRLEGEMDGIEAAELIMSRFGIPVVYMTAHADENILRRAKSTGPFGYVLKPFEERELDIAIQMALYRHRTEESLRVEHQNLINILGSMNDGVHIINKDFDVEYCNPVIEKEFGSHRGRKCYAYFHEREDVCPWCKLPEVLNGKTIHWDFQYPKTGRSFDCFETPMRKADGSVSKLKILHDITERRKMEDALKKSENLFRNYFELGQVGMAITSLDQEWLRVNERLCEILGYSRGELETMTWTELTYPDDLEPDLIQFRKLLGGEIERYSMDKRFIRKDGTLIYAHIAVSCQRRPDRSVEYFIASVQDISDRKRAEEVLRLAKEQAEEATKLKDKFVSLVAHDLRGPLATLLSYLGLISDVSSDPEQRKAMAEIARRTGNKMVAMIDDLLNVSRLKTGQIRPSISFFNLNLAVLQLVEEFKRPAGQKGIKIENKVAKSHRLFGDRQLYYEAIRNLMSNAVKFCRKGDSITLFAPEERPGVLAVSDTGVGIKPERMRDLFKYEVKTSTPGTEGEPGTGLGLPLARDMMEAQGGSIAVEPRPGGGSVFFAALPDIKPIALVVDDDPLARGIIRTVIEAIDVAVVEAGDGEKALEAIERTVPHIIITDLVMPGMDGFAFLEKVRQNPNTRKVPVIVVASDRRMEIRDKAFRTGANDFIAKPITQEDLAPRVRRFLE